MPQPSIKQPQLSPPASQIRERRGPAVYRLMVFAVDAVSINATLNYLRTYGLDTTADSYGIHFYPNANATSAQRYNDLANNALTQCGKYGVSCTVTEWGFRLPSFTCPLNDSSRHNLADEILTDVANWGPAVRSMVWFDWLST